MFPFTNPFKKKEPGAGMSMQKIEMALNIARSMGFDIQEKIEEFAPKLLAAALHLEHQAGTRLTGMINIADDSSHFIVSLYRIMPAGQLELWKHYALTDIKALIDQLKTAITAPDTADATDTPHQHIAALPAPAAGDPSGSTDEYNWAGNAATAQLYAEWERIREDSGNGNYNPSWQQYIDQLHQPEQQ